MNHIKNKDTEKRSTLPRGGVWRSIISLLLVMVTLACGIGASCLPAAAVDVYKMPATDASDSVFMDAIVELRARALASCGRRSFKGYCAWYVNLQLYLLDINKKYVTGDGKDEFNNYRNLKYTTGGYRVHAYPEDEYTLKSALNAIVHSAGGMPVRNVLAGFSKAGGDGEKYGHTFFIHLIRDGYVYFSDSIGVTVGGTYYPEGRAIKCTINELFKFYAPSSFILDGVIWFEDESETPLVPPTTEVTVKEPSVCRVTADVGLRVRSGPGTGYDRLALIPYGTELYVTEISADGLWGRVFYDGCDGWSSLEYMEAASSPELPAVIYDHYSGGEHVSRIGYASLTDAAADAAELLSKQGGEVRLIPTRALTGDISLTLTAGMVLDCGTLGIGTANIKLGGGELWAASEIAEYEADPFISAETRGERRRYSSALNLEMRSASLSINDNVSIRFGVYISDTTGLKRGDIDLTLIWRTSSGESGMGQLSDIGENGLLYFYTDGIQPKKLTDTVYGYVIATATDDRGVSYARASQEVSYSVTRYAANMYGGGSEQDTSRRKLDRLLSAMMSYGAAAQLYFDYETDSLATSYLPEAGRTPPEYSEQELFRTAEPAPILSYEGDAHIMSASLELGGCVGIRMRADGMKEGYTYRLLVWSHSEYKAIAAATQDLDSALKLASCKKLLSPTDDGVFLLDDIPAKMLADTYYFRMVEIAPDGSERYDRMISYSVTTYCANKASGSGALAELCRAIAVYSAAAREYFDYTPNG